jgi:threonine synthase
VTKTVIVSTASPYKFTKSVIKGIKESIEEKNEFKLIEMLSENTGIIIPEPIKDLDQKPVLHDMKCEKDRMKDIVKGILDI